MYRDFSEKSKQNLKKLVDQVENEKVSNFTDWVGDRWYEYESWIGKLNIRNYINNVNAYHKKVIDKNNTTKQAIDEIFENVATVDANYSERFKSRNAQLQIMIIYISQLENIVNPNNGRFSANYITSSMNSKFKDFSVLGLEALLCGSVGAVNTSESSWKEKLGTGKTIFKELSGIGSGIGKVGKNDKATFASTLLSYLSTICGISSEEYNSGTDIASSILTLFKSSGKVETGLFNYYPKKLSPYDASKLDGKFGKSMTGLSVLVSLASAADTGIDTYKVFTDSNSSAYDKSAQVLKMSGSVFDFGTSSYKAVLASSKTLQVVNNSPGNQILATEITVKYGASKAVTDKLSKIGTAAAIGSVIVSTGASAVKQYGKVIEDGELDMGDVGSVGLHGSLSGLNTVTSTLSLGIVNFDGEKVADELETDASDYLKNDSWAAKYVKDQNKNAVLRFGVSMGIGTELVAKKVITGVGDGVNAVGGWISDGWNYLFN